MNQMEQAKNERSFRVGELAKLSGIPTSTLRFWQRQGFIGSTRSQGGHRLFNDRDLRWVLQARDLTQGRYLTADLASTIESLIEAGNPHSPAIEAQPLRGHRHEANYERMLELASQNAQLFSEQRELASKIAQSTSELATMQEVYRSALERIGECVWSAEVQRSGALTFRLCTPAIQTITGLQSEVFFAEPSRWADIVFTKDRPQFEEAFERVYEGHSIDVEYRIMRTDGMARWVRNTVHPSVDVNGRVSRLDGILADVTERKLIELSLRASEQKLRVALESFPDTILTQDRELRYTSDLNPQVTLTHGDVRGTTVWNVLPPHEAENITKIRQLVLQTGKTIREIVPITIQGSIHYNDMVTSPLRGAGGEIEGIISYSRDITDQVLREQQLQDELAALRRSFEEKSQSEEYYRRIVEQMGVTKRVSDQTNHETHGADTEES